MGASLGRRYRQLRRYAAASRSSPRPLGHQAVIPGLPQRPAPAPSADTPARYWSKVISVVPRKSKATISTRPRSAAPRISRKPRSSASTIPTVRKPSVCPDTGYVLGSSGRISQRHPRPARARRKPCRARAFASARQRFDSPTLADQLRNFLKIYPQAKWHVYEPINRDTISKARSCGASLPSALLPVELKVTPRMTMPWNNAARKQVVSMRSCAGGRPARNISPASCTSDVTQRSMSCGWRPPASLQYRQRASCLVRGCRWGW